MKSIYVQACAVMIASGLAVPALAASTNQNTTGATTNDQTPATTTQEAAPNAMTSGNMHIAQKMRDDLSKAGFTDIRIMPSSFLVRAKDKSGNPVMMVVNPDSVTAITEEQAPSSASNSTKMNGTNNSASGSQTTNGSTAGVSGQQPKP